MSSHPSPLAFRADHVGSLLRPPAVKDAHLAYAEEKLTLAERRATEDQAIYQVLQLQQEVGLRIFSDGEFRRASWAGDFQESMSEGYVEGSPAVSVFNTAQGNGAAPAGPIVPGSRRGRVIGARLVQQRRLTEHEAAFLRQHAPGPWKMTMPAASYMLARGYNPAITDPVYGTRAAALADVAAILKREAEALVTDGAAYIQFDNPHYPDYLVPERNDAWRAAGVDPVRALQEDIEADNFALSGIDRARATVAMHLCRGNGGRGQDQAAGWHTSGGYEPIAERLFGQLNVDRFLLEYDSERAGGFEPLRFIPRGKTVVLGLVTTKSGELEKQETLLRRIEEAAKHVAMDNLALSPQCGFASTLPGNPLTEDEERRKLELVVDTARRAWGL
jgi:5-methyltetrahydropteroyltriglutamate--homocysteine methyltransferase